MLSRKSFPAPPKASNKDQPPVQAEKKEALHPVQKSSIAVPITTTRSGKIINPPKRLGFDKDWKNC